MDRVHRSGGRSLKRLDAPSGSLPNRNRGRKIAADFNNFAPTEPHREIEPVRPNVGDRAEVASQFRFQPPVPVCRIKEPVLQKISMHQARLPDRAAGYACASLLTK